MATLREAIEADERFHFAPGDSERSEFYVFMIDGDDVDVWCPQSSDLDSPCELDGSSLGRELDKLGGGWDYYMSVSDEFAREFVRMRAKIAELEAKLAVRGGE